MSRPTSVRTAAVAHAPPPLPPAVPHLPARTAAPILPSAAVEKEKGLMDSLTQMVLGAAVGELVLGRKVGNKAILWGAIAGTIPDLDVLSSLFLDDLRANEVHRGVTHSLLFSLVAAPLFGRWIKRHQQSFLAVFIALLALVFVPGAAHIGTQVAIAAVALGITLVAWRVKPTDTATAREWGWLFWWVLVTHALLDCFTT